MTSKERAKLRAEANSLEPIIQIGKDGISDNLILQVSDALDARELIKVRVHLDTAPKSAKEFSEELKQALDAEIIQVIGGVIVIYRKSEKDKTEKKKVKVKPNAKKAQKKQVKIKGLRQREAEAHSNSYKSGYKNSYKNGYKKQNYGRKGRGN